jgi:putative ABC transport system permease protein
MQNLRYAFRIFGKQPLFRAIVILTFALGIGANTAVFSVLNAVILRPLPRLNAMLVGLFALIALLLAAAGIFGVMSYSVTQRTQEIGIRLALGTQRYGVLRLIIFQGMRFVGAGVVLGLIGVFACARLLQSLLFGIGATDLGTMLAVTAILTAVAFIACLLPARRATLVDPVQALRAE